MLAFILWPALAIGCFSLAAKGFSEKGIPFSGNRHITGTAGKVVGVLCGLLGLACLGMLLLVIIGRSSR